MSWLTSMPIWFKPLIFLLGLLPLATLLSRALGNQLGPDPGEAMMLGTGEWAARLLIATLLISPLRAILNRGWLIRLRRMLGLYTFFYGCLHLLLFLNFYLGWQWARLWEELVERPYITVGFLGWLLMLPLAVTSNHLAQRRLRRNWQRLHRLVYATAILVSLHYLWQARSDIGEALLYSVIFAALLLWRLVYRWRRKPGTQR